MDTERIHTLLDHYVDESLSAAEKAELEQILLSSPRARQLFWEHVRFHAALRRLGEENWGKHLASLSGSEGLAAELPGHGVWTLHVNRLGVGLRRYGGWVVAAAVMALAMFDPPARNVLPAKAVGERMTSGIAVLTQAVDAEWDADSQYPTRGGSDRTGGVLGRVRLKLKAGLVKIEFNSGARVILEGPVEFELVSGEEGLCQSGRLTAQVPPQAAGFRVGSPRLTVEGAGTSFALDVREGGTSEVYVERGEVELVSRGRPGRRRLLGAGEATRVSRTNTFEAVPSNDNTFQTAADFERRSATNWARRRQSWVAAGQATDNDPDLLVRYSFEPSSQRDRSLRNSRPDATPQSDGAIVGCEWVEGRWPGKGALEFKRVSDRVRLLVAGEFDAITLVAWVRVDVENTVKSLMMSEGWEPGDLHWQISKEGEVVLGVHDGRGSRGVNYRSPVVFTAERIGQWFHLAVVYDSHVGRVTHYVNGQAAGSNRVESNVRLRIGNAELGNWTPGVKATATPIRNFHGRMDEFLAFGRMLKAEEVGRLFEAGQPGL